MKHSKEKIKTAVASSYIRRKSSNPNLVNETDYKKLAPYDEPCVIETEKYGEIDLLSRTELKVLKAISSLIDSETNKTERVYIEDLSKNISHPVSTLKKLIQKLEKKFLLKREYFKAGRGGWTIYSIDSQTRDKLEIN